MARLKDKLNPFHSKGVGTLATKKINDQIILASGSYDNTIKIWQINNDNCEHLRTLTEHEEDVSSLIFTDNRLISGSYDRTIKIWNTDSWECEDTLEQGHHKKIECLALTYDSQYLLVSSYESVEIYLWDLKQREPKHKPKYKFSVSGNIRGKFKQCDNGVLGLVTNHKDKTVISSAMDGCLISWQILKEGDKVELNRTTIHDGESLQAITSLAISPDGKYLAVGENSQQITIWDIATKSMVYSTQGKHDVPNILGLAYHPTGEIVASTSFDAKNPIIRLWNPRTGDIITTLTYESHSSPIRSLIFSPDGTMLISSDEAGHIFLWGV